MNNRIISLGQKMDKAIQMLSQDLGSIRAGRASPALVEHVKIKAYGGSTELTISELASIHASDPSTLIITPFDPSVLEEIERGLQQSNLGITVANEGELIRLTVPPLTQERRDEFIKLAKIKAEHVRVMIRQVRQEGINTVRDDFSAKVIAEDEKFRLEKDIQKVTDEKSARVDELLENKITELSSV